MLTKDEIIDNIESPKELEHLYQNNTKEFTQFFSEIYSEYPNSIVLQTWFERLNYQPSKTESADNTKKRSLTISIIIGVVTGLLTIFLIELYYGDIAARNIVPLILFSLVIYFGIKNLRNKYVIIGGIIVIAGITYFLNILPYDWQSDSVLLSEVHIFVFFWFIIGLTYIAPKLDRSFQTH